MLSQSETDSKIRVKSDGVKLGWNVMAIVASVGLGLYVSSVVSPIRATTERVEEDFDKFKEKIEAQLVAIEREHSSMDRERHELAGKIHANDIDIQHCQRDLSKALEEARQHHEHHHLHTQ